MSIIYDALKKIQQDRHTPSRFSRFFRRSFFDWILLILMIALVFSIIFFYYERHVKQTSHFMLTLHKTSQASSIKQPQKIAQAKSTVSNELNEQAFKAKHELKGIFVSEHEKVAMINHQFFHEGDEIDGMKIIDMKMDHITLQNGGGTFVLRLLG